ncbi:hypothetical protein EWE74_10830 [Sphingobacterium corticibacterium]|uniref:Uncharacterized protein n=2 Tax=Sphingobacterium corticibacterium TaxID=2484746 RepID=A0A4Q6XSW0_9SPHI|nr:hypothetical protein EWE74_10830 [Sphingobacterium corticibacterium]
MKTKVDDDPCFAFVWHKTNRKNITMDNNKRLLLEQRRQQLQVEIKAETYIERYITPVQEIFDYLRQQEVTYQIAGIVYVPAEYLLYVEQAITKTPYDTYGFQSTHLQKPYLEQLIDTMFNRFPSTNPLRYVPDLPEYANYNGVRPENGFRDGLQQVMQALGLQDQQAYIYYLNYGVVLQLPLAALSNHEHEELFNGWHGEVLIFPIELEWLIVFTLEEEWLGGTGE